MYSFPRSLTPPAPLPDVLFGRPLNAKLEVDIWTCRLSLAAEGSPAQALSLIHI